MIEFQLKLEGAIVIQDENLSRKDDVIFQAPAIYINKAIDDVGVKIGIPRSDLYMDEAVLFIAATPDDLDHAVKVSSPFSADALEATMVTTNPGAFGPAAITFGFQNGASIAYLFYQTPRTGFISALCPVVLDFFG